LKKYDYILFDADETLFRYDALRGLQQMFSRYGVAFTEEDYADYQLINKPLWVAYQNGEITAAELKHRRFLAWSEKLNVPTGVLGSSYLDAMAEICTPLEGAVSLLSALKGRARLGIITNGFMALQKPRLMNTGLSEFIDFLVVSEVVGIAKPHRGIFDHALQMMGTPARESVLMVGDNPESDILGGLNAGLDTCWLNVEKKPVPEGIQPLYEVSSLSELERLLTD
jgi:YjjG family noncanonical pyrimidine nucleotidase